MKLLIINGPNLNLVGKRETGIYGKTPFSDYLETLRARFNEIELTYFQSNIEGEIIDHLQAADRSFQGVILNAGGYTHTSVAIGDAVKAIQIPVIEVHISNILSREDFRQRSFISEGAQGVISGFGLDSYHLAIVALQLQAS